MAVSRVVVIRGNGVVQRRGEVDATVLSRMLDLGLRRLTDQNADAGLRTVFSPADRVGIKINAIAAPELATPPAVVLPFVRLLASAGVREKNIMIWDRTNSELRQAGYKLSSGGAAVQICGTDTAGIGYGSEPTIHLNIGSLFSAIQTDFISASVSFAVLKDHGLAGVTAGLKNYFGAIHNPNKYHDDACDPFIPELFDSPPIRSKHRLTVLDALVVQYHRGPSYNPKWAETAESLVFSLDPVAADYIGWQMIERFRRAKGLPSLEEENRAPRYIMTAAKMGLGRAAANEIQIIEDAA